MLATSVATISFSDPVRLFVICRGIRLSSSLVAVLEIGIVMFHVVKCPDQLVYTVLVEWPLMIAGLATCHRVEGMSISGLIFLCLLLSSASATLSYLCGHRS